MRWKWVLTVWLGFAMTQIPLLLYTRAHPGALTRRFDATTFITDDMSRFEIGWRAAVNYLQDLQIWHYAYSGDVKPYAHTPGAGALLGASLLLSLVGLVLVLLRLRSDPFWRYAVAALAVSPVRHERRSSPYRSLRSGAPAAARPSLGQRRHGVRGLRRP